MKPDFSKAIKKSKINISRERRLGKFFDWKLNKFVEFELKKKIKFGKKLNPGGNGGGFSNK